MTTDHGLPLVCPWTPLGTPSPDPRYRLVLRARHVCPPHIVWLGDAPAQVGSTVTPITVFKRFSTDATTASPRHRSMGNRPTRKPLERSLMQRASVVVDTSI